MADSEDALSGDMSSDESGDSGGVADDFPTVEPAPEPDNPRYSTEHEEPSGEPQPIPGAGDES